jgi:hypothetical protein
MIQQIIREDVPVLGACDGLFTFCTLANIASVMQALGVIAAATTAIVVLMHRLYAIWRGGKL